MARLQQAAQSVRRHFPNVTAADLAMTNRDGRTLKWDNRVAWARQYLVETGHIDGSVHGQWKITEIGRQDLCQRLTSLGVSEPGSFIASPRSLAEIASPTQWSWPERQKRRGARIAHRPSATSVSPTETQPSQPRAAGQPSAAPTPAPTSIRDELLAKLNSMDERQFEDFVGRVLAELGYDDVDVVGRSGDGGVDVRCVLKGPLIDPPLTVVCQVKRHASNIGPSAVGDLRGRWAHRADRLILVNTAGFTQGAREAATEPGAKEISLISGEDLAAVMIDKGIGVSKEPVVVERLDEGFFGS